jgi:NADH-quinone oxidoreductase subunit L
LAAVGGLLNVPHGLGGHPYLADWLAPILGSHGGEEAESLQLENILMAVSVVVALAGIGLATVIYYSRKVVPVSEETHLSPLHRLVYGKFYIDELYDVLIVKPIGLLSRVFGFVIEYLVIDLGVALVGAVARVTGRTLRYSQTGSTGVYLLLMVASIALYLAFLFQDSLL